MYPKQFLLACTLLLCLSVNYCKAQRTLQQKLDSAVLLLPKLKSDTNKAMLLYKLSANYATVDAAKSEDYAGQLLTLSQKLNWPKGIVAGNSVLANVNYQKHDLAKAQEYMLQGLKEDYIIGNKTAIANDLANVGSIYWQQKNFPVALDYFAKQLKIEQELGNKKGAATASFYIAELNRMQGNLQAAADNYLVAQKLDEELKDQKALANIASDLATVYDGLNKVDEAISYNLLAIKLNLATGNKSAVALNEGNLGFLYSRQHNYVKALDYYQQAKKLYNPKTDMAVMANNLNNLGVLYGQQGNYAAALDSCYFQALKIAKEVKNDKLIMSITRNIGNAYLQLADVTNASDYFLQSIKLSEETGKKIETGVTLNRLGLLYQNQSNYPKALDYYLQSLKISESLNNKTGVASCLKNIGILYSAQGNQTEALNYTMRALKIHQDLNSAEGIQTDMNSIGIAYAQAKNYTKALEYLTAGLKMEEEIGDKFNIATNLNDIGDVYNRQGNYSKALDYTMKALKIQESLGARNNSAYILSTIGEIYLAIAQNKTYNIPASDTLIPKNRAELLAKTADYLKRGFDIFKQAGNLDMMQVNLEHLADVEEMQGNYNAALADYKKHIVYRDSVFNREKDKEITRRQLQFDFGKREDSIKYQQAITDGLLKEKTLLTTQQQQTLQLNNQQLALDSKEKELQHLAYLKQQADLEAEQGNRKQKEKQLTIAEKERALQASHVKLQEAQLKLKDADLQSEHTQKLFYIAGVVLLVILAFFIGYNFINQQKANKQIMAKNILIEAEKQKSDDLLLNILPAEIAEELKQKGETEAQMFDNVSVLFTDFVNFTGISESLTPKQLVNEIHQCFTAFDAIVERHGLEKIKTIGDAYLAVCGLPNTDPLHAQKTVNAAIEIRDFIVHRKAHNNGEFNIRIGINSGPLVAGIVGVKKFAYDIWGDTVNTAARMEQNSSPGKVNISQTTYEHVKEQFAFTYRGEIEAKNKGMLKMYFADILEN